MNISTNTQTAYSSLRYLYGADHKTVVQSREENPEMKSHRTQKMRELIRGLSNQKQEKSAYSSTASDKMNGFLELCGVSESKKEETEVKKPVNYNYKEVSSKIRQAKNSVSAEQAVLSAKRKVLELKRKISSGDGDDEELQIALTHAKRMEMAARKKKNHLEQEELVVATGKRDEAQKKMEDACSGLKNALISAEEEKVSKQEDEILETREDMIHDVAQELKERNSEQESELLSELNEMISEFGEDELKALEEATELLEDMEIIDPHMSKEDLEDLKRKHRAAENKAIMKADMDYLKDMIRHQLDMGSGVQSFGNAVSIGLADAGLSVSPEVCTGVAVDVQC